MHDFCAISRANGAEIIGLVAIVKLAVNGFLGRLLRRFGPVIRGGP